MTRSTVRFASSLVLAAACLAASPAAAQFYGTGPQTYGEGFGKNKVQYRDFDWKIYRSPHFNVFYYTAEEGQLQKVVSFAESAYDRLSREFNFQIKDPVPLIYYATHSAFEQNNIILNFIPEGVGAFASPVRYRMVLPIDLPDTELIELVLHELTHIFQYHMLFQGSLAKAITTSPPTWFMEGMASYMAKDETARDKMFLRDAVVNDRIPSVTRAEFGGFFAYRFGHAVFDFVEERWGREGFLDFLYETRNTIGSRVDRAVKRTFKMEPEDFDLEFRRWLRKKYLPELVATGEPSDFGRVFRLGRELQGEITSPSASPSGDLVASLAAYRGDVDVVLFDTEKRTLLRNLTKGYSNDYQYIVGQELTGGRRFGRDLDFSPDGNTIAVFAKREKGRSLLLLDVLRGGTREVIEMDDVEQQGAPAFSPDGKKVAFFGHQKGQFDLFVLDLESRTIVNLTNDAVYDGAPSFSPDGRSVVFVSTVGEEGEGGSKVFRVDLDKPGQRFQLTTGASNENDPVYSPDGKRIYFTSDRNGGRDNVYGLDLETGQLRQYTDVVTGAFMPTVLPPREREGRERVVYAGFWKGTFDLYVRDADEPVKEPETVEIPAAATTAHELPGYKPDIEVTLDEANKEKYGAYKFFLEGAENFIGVDDDQTLIGRVVLRFSDYLGDHRILAAISSVDSFQNFDVIYADFSNRWQWQVHLFDERDYYLNPNLGSIGVARRDQLGLQITGATGSLIYPFTFYHRFEIGTGYVYRKIFFPAVVFNPETGQLQVEFQRFQDDFPLVVSALVGDSTIFANWGPISGRRYRLDLQYAPDLDDSGTLFESVDLDFRQYIPITQRSNLAIRAFAGASGGNVPNVFYFGGLDTVRGVPFRSIAGDRAFFANFEYRFPLIDVLATPVLAFQGVRGVLFFDVGGAWFSDFEDFDFYDEDNSQLKDGIASYGWGLTTRFLGIDLNWDFIKRVDPPPGAGNGFATNFWIGYRF